MRAYMSLACKSGSYSMVLQELMDMNIPAGEIYLLFGPFDILCKFESENMEEFKKKWFNRVRMIGAEKDWITRTMTFIVIKSSPETMEVPYAYIFLNTHPKDLEKIREQILNIPRVLTSDSVFGPYDVICSIRAVTTSDLKQTVSQIQSFSGVVGTVTSIIAGMRV